MTGEHWRGEDWPAAGEEARRLPSLDELPVVERGYDPERVQDAFDAFYRHIAQLDSTLRAIEAVDAFRQQAGELRSELRALRAAGWSQQPWPAYRGTGGSSPGISEALPRFAIEAAFLIVVAVVVAVAGFDALSIVLVMALAWAIVGVVEWAASRERFARATSYTAAPAREAEVPVRAVPAAPQPALEAPVVEPWPVAADAEFEVERTVAASPDELALDAMESEPEPDAVFEEDVLHEEPAALGPADDEPVPEAEALEEAAAPGATAGAEAVEEAVAAPEATAGAEAVEEVVAAPEATPEADRWAWAADPAVESGANDEDVQPRRGRFWRRRKKRDAALEPDDSRPKHVRVLPPPPTFDEQFPVEPRSPDRELDPWEQGFDISVESEAEVEAPEADVEEAAEDARPLAELRAHPEGDPERS